MAEITSKETGEVPSENRIDCRFYFLQNSGMKYSSPGKADQLTPELFSAWNDEIGRQFQALQDDQNLHSRFLHLDPDNIPEGDDVSVAWFGDPAEPAFCFDEDVARKLSDWGIRGRHELHNEYCEYFVRTVVDAAGQQRPKRVEFTTELREYWVMLAVESPDFTRDLARQILGFAPSWQELYGVSDPLKLSKLQRKVAFSKTVAGNGKDPELVQAGVPSHPSGSLNTEHALFMSHPINGLDDLIYIVLFGAKPYGRVTPTGRQPATKEQIFRHFGVTHLACRHADPRAATAAHDKVFEGKELAFANPLGVYIASFSTGDLRYKGESVPSAWKSLSRGGQRLVFGPSDDEEIFLDEIVVVEGAAERPLTGGYDLAKRVEVGPLLRVSRGGAVDEAEYVDLPDSIEDLKCSEADVCTFIGHLKRDYDMTHSSALPGPRRMASLG